MDMLFELSVAAVSVCVGALVLVRRAGSRSPAASGRIDVAPVSRSWLADHRTRHRHD
jgi:hypothetical protein